ncbi:FTR1 family iron permease [Campylobacter sp. MIT 21-1685]|uniref:FTR1 family iron permease n=1 Tax=unclassified Campylobacter TaxID=2593542 RepID=UPI00224ADA3E|nr:MULTISPECIES: FTR1 family protein [unclassified Campylobacter]MCX2682602.1 FTR1 family iron permease [Campylobacter sp. MIT 21-1684]MCX2750882.1 FTR1 family iron permease [Campylobacter sp. MIT 21-1682]MCX2807185.1 FTR1 family iron permease [Campylobacter sp. MIT 21-1685]
MKILKNAFFFISIFLVNLSFARVDDYIAEANIIKELLQQSIELYKKDDNQAAKKMIEDAYFQHFENMEGAIGRNIGRKSLTMERKFSTLRRMYKEKADLDQIKALIETLSYDLDEVSPLLQNGYRLKAEKSDTNDDEEAIQTSSIQANKQREKDAEALIASIMGENPDSDSQTDTNRVNKQDDDLQNAAAMDMKLQYILDSISTKFSQSATAFKEKHYEQSKNFLQEALFNDYRNTKVEILVNKFTQVGNDQKIQQSIRALIRKINENSINEKDLRTNLDAIEEQLFDIFLQIPKEQLNLLAIDGFADTSIGKDYNKVADDIKDALNEILRNYEGFNLSTIDDLQNIYLDIFEASGMENKIGAVDSTLKLKIESTFSQGLALIKASADKQTLEKSFNELDSLIRLGASKITDSTPYSLFIWALSILLREGLEALIIVVAIVSYLLQSGNKKHLSIAYSALWTGIILSFITAFCVSWLFKENAGQSRELIEGFTMLVAVVLLFYVGFWLLSNAQNKKWASFIKENAIAALSKNSAKTLWFTVFLAVYREGAETILFYQALFFDAKTNTDYGAIFAGLGLGIIGLIVLYYLLKAGAIRIPIKQFFYITSYIIFYMIFVFTGKAIAELIEGKLITPTLIGVNFEPILWLGIYPYYETLIPQAIVLVMLVIGVCITIKFTNIDKKFEQ